MLEVTLTVTLTLRAPVLTQSSTVGAYGLDAPMARASNGCYCLPMSLIKGRFKQALEELHEAAGAHFNPPLDEWLGKQTGSQINSISPVEPSRGRLRFSDFINHGGKDGESLFRIRIDEERGAVDKGAYQTMEAPFASGELVNFTGTIRFTALDQNEADHIHKDVELGLRWITSLGAERTVGFGQLVNVEVMQSTQRVAATNAIPSTSTKTLDLILIPDAPFCIARLRVASNLFESDEIIPGGVLKGCVASALLASQGHQGVIRDDTDPSRPELCRHFANLRFTHAFPAIAGVSKRPVVPPFSLIKDRAEDIYDIALSEEPCLVGAPPSAPAFRVDWKRADDVQNLFGWGTPGRELRVRTAMDRTTRRGKDQSLFAYEMIVPDGFVWYANVDLSRVPDAERFAVEAQLRSLLSHQSQTQETTETSLRLHHLGKTKVSAEVELRSGHNIDAVFSSQLQPFDGSWIVTLQTDAILCDPALLDEASGRDELHNAYAAAWATLSNGSLEMVRFWASQSLAGGYYLHNRFQRGNSYNPYLLTEAGSVFVLKSANNQLMEAQEHIEDWFAHGLPLPDWATQRYSHNGLDGNHWANCPFLPENGFGEIAINLEVHRNLFKKEAFHAIS